VVGVIRKFCLVMVVPLALAACSSESTESDSTAGDGSLAVELSGPMGSVENPMTVSGPAVDDGLMCESLVMVQSDFADLDGNPLTMDDVAELHQSSADFVWTETYTCDDDSGTFTAQGEQLLTAPEIDDEGVTEGLARSTIQSGTGAYETLTGQWEWTGDFATGTTTMTGAVSEE
jgi:hypothetical protein